MAKKSATRRILTITGIVAIVLVLLGVVGWQAGFFGGGEEGIRVETADAEQRTITQVVTAFGRAQPEVEVTISPDVPGEIIELPIEEGDPVSEGQLLARIKPDAYEAQREQAEANLKQMRASLEQRRADMLQAERTYNRQQKLYEREVTSESGLEDARTQYEVAQANFKAAQYQVENAEARLEEADKQLNKTSIYAPMDGTISKLSVEAGERVVGTSQMQGTEMMRIARLDQMELEVDVNENDVVNVALSDTASIEIDAYPDQSFRGSVTEIANSARVEGQGTQEQVTNFPVKVRVLDAHNLTFRTSERGGGQVAAQQEEVPMPPRDTPVLRPGMSGTVDIFTQTVNNVVAVPIQAVTVRDFNQVRDGSAAAQSDSSAAFGRREDLRKVVFVVAADTARMQEVTTGIADDTHIEVRSGLNGGEQVIIGPYRAVSQTLEPGAKVRIEEPGERDGEALAAAQ
ncbi:MAG: efflux RND transporter periplasmic adaptor subunit [Bacteroidetes bacterium]|jgi:HlyD family secretion protein|nr:efflux RND transporter periplasmic adaptor subunit [Bacteroidota bacterium]